MVIGYEVSHLANTAGMRVSADAYLQDVRSIPLAERFHQLRSILATTTLED